MLHVDGCAFELIDGLETWTCVGASFAGPECDGARLPSRAEWELASRAGGVSCFPDGSGLADGCVPPTADDPARIARYPGNAIADYNLVGSTSAHPARVRRSEPGRRAASEPLRSARHQRQRRRIHPDRVGLPRSVGHVGRRARRRKPEFVFDVDRETQLASMGNQHFSHAHGTCAYVELIAPAVPIAEDQIKDSGSLGPYRRSRPRTTDSHAKCAGAPPAPAPDFTKTFQDIPVIPPDIAAAYPDIPTPSPDSLTVSPDTGAPNGAICIGSKHLPAVAPRTILAEADEAQPHIGDRIMTQTLVVPPPDVPRWQSVAQSPPQPANDLQISVPVTVLFGEAADLAGFVNTYVDPVRDGAKVVRPGLTMANRRRAAFTFGPETATDLLSLMASAQSAVTSYALQVTPTAATDLRDAAREDLAELQGAIAMVLDDGVEDENDKQLAQLDETHKDPTNDDLLAAALADYAGMARQPAIYAELQELAGQDGFELATIARCEAHVNTLRLLPPAPRPRSPEALAAFQLRNQLVNLLQQRVRLVRAAARWVFRKQPAIARQATSAYERRQRAELRRKQKTEKKPA